MRHYEGRADHYVRDLGHGTQGRAMLMRDDHGHQVVAKLALAPHMPEEEADAFLREDVLREAEAHRYAVGRDDLRHGNVVGYLGAAYREEGLPLLLQEYVPGKKLGREEDHDSEPDDVDTQPGGMLRRVPLDNGDRDLATRHVFLQVAAALGHLAQRGMVHLDIKPSNIMVCSGNGDLKLIDFGCGLPSTDGGAQAKERGSRSYMAPEVMTHDSPYPIGPAADAWSMGVMLHRACLGRGPFDPEDGSSLSRWDLEDRVKLFASDPRQRVFAPGPDRPLTPVQDLINQLLHPDPAQRPTMDQVRAHPYFRMTETEAQRGRQLVTGLAS